MALSIQLPSGLTVDSALTDIEAILNAGLDLLLPADAMRLVRIGEQVVADAAKLALNPPTANAELQAGIDAEQAAVAAEETAQFPKG